MKTKPANKYAIPLGYGLYLIAIQLAHACAYEWARRAAGSETLIFLADVVVLLLLFGPAAVILMKKGKNPRGQTFGSQPWSVNISVGRALKLAIYCIAVVFLWESSFAGDYCIQLLWAQVSLEPSTGADVFLSFYAYLFDSAWTLVLLLMLPLLAGHQARQAKGSPVSQGC